MTLDDRIKATGLSTDEIASRAGISRTSLWRLRTGGEKSDWNTAKAIADVLGCTPADVCPRFAAAS